MSQVVYEARKKYGGGYLTVFPHGLVVPWKTLCLADYIFYTREITNHSVQLVFLEDEIFSKTVLDASLVRQINFLPAGIVSTVVQNIVQHSGPNGIDSFNEDLERMRVEILEGPSAALHDLVSLITNAFPYKPEEIYAMDYETFLLRVVQAEKKLIVAGVIKEPVQLLSKGEDSQKRRPRNQMDAQRIKEAFDKQIRKSPEPQERPMPKVDRKALIPLQKTKKWWKKSPVLEVPLAQREKINFRMEAAEQDIFAASGWEKVDREIMQVTMVESAQKIYADLLVELAKKYPPKK